MFHQPTVEFRLFYGWNQLIELRRFLACFPFCFSDDCFFVDFLFCSSFFFFWCLFGFWRYSESEEKEKNWNIDHILIILEHQCKHKAIFI